MIRKISMVSTIVVLVFLIIITPTFISQQSPLGAAPLIFIDNLNFKVVVDVHSVVVEYRYRNISMRVAGLDNLSYRPPPILENDTYDVHTVVAKNDTHKFELNVTLYDQARRGYDYNVTIEAKGSADNYVMLVWKPGSDSPSTVGLGSTFRDAILARRTGG